MSAFFICYCFLPRSITLPVFLFLPGLFLWLMSISLRYQKPQMKLSALDKHFSIVVLMHTHTCRYVYVRVKNLINYQFNDPCVYKKSFSLTVCKAIWREFSQCIIQAEVIFTSNLIHLTFNLEISILWNPWKMSRTFGQMNFFFNKMKFNEMKFDKMTFNEMIFDYLIWPRFRYVERTYSTRRSTVTTCSVHIQYITGCLS